MCIHSFFFFFCGCDVQFFRLQRPGPPMAYTRQTPEHKKKKRQSRMKEILQKLVTSPIDHRLYFPIAVPIPTVGDGRRTVGTTDMFL
jgi:hypothetical protein